MRSHGRACQLEHAARGAKRPAGPDFRGGLATKMGQLLGGAGFLETVAVRIIISRKL